MEAAVPQPPENSAAATPVASFEVVELNQAQKKWQLAVYEGHLALSNAPGAQPYVLLRAGFPKEFNFAERLRALSVIKPFKVTLKLTPEATTAVAHWFGDSFLAATYLKRRFSFVLPWAILWLLMALPLPGNPAQGIAPKSFHPVDFGMALGLVGAWALARWRPHSGLFLVDGLWFGYLTVHLTLSVVAGKNKLWLILVMALASMSITGLQHFLRFRRTRIQPLKT
jgi:hypothetical protein